MPFSVHMHKSFGYLLVTEEFYFSEFIQNLHNYNHNDIRARVFTGVDL